MKGSEIILTCKGCRKRYNVGDADRVARIVGTRDVTCPHCGVKVGTSN
jgi:DNA-directed RNA polymerase subunit RPC12/RpoP